MLRTLLLIATILLGLAIILLNFKHTPDNQPVKKDIPYEKTNYDIVTISNDSLSSILTERFK